MERMAIGSDGHFHRIDELTADELKAWNDGMHDADVEWERRKAHRLYVPPTAAAMLNYKQQLQMPVASMR